MSVFFQCLGITGVIALFYGLLAFAITQAKTGFFIALIVFGLVCMAAFLLHMFTKASKSPGLLRDMFNQRSIGSGLGTAFYTLFVVCILALLNVLSQRFFHFQKDFTANQVFTLSEQTVKQLENLDTDITVKAFFSEQNQLKEALKENFKLYQGLSNKLAVEFVDADKDNLQAQKEQARDGDIIYIAEGKRHVSQDVSEQGITQALMKITQSAASTVCMTTGHGELDYDAEARDPRSISFVKLGLENEGFAVKKLESLLPEVSADCAILLAAGPQQAFAANEAGAIDAWLQKGGKAIFLLDPNVEDPNLVQDRLSVLDTGLEAMLSAWGVSLGKNIILEKQLQLFSGEQTGLVVRATRYGDHPIVDPLKAGKPTVYQVARSVQRLDSFTGTTVELVSSAAGGASWSQSDVDTLYRQGKASLLANDIKGPVPMAVASEKELDEGKKAQVVVVGDSDFMSNGLVRSYEYNFDMVLNMLTWLSGEQEKISIRPKRMRTSNIDLTAKQQVNIFYVSIIALPMLVLMFGLNLWWYRRRRG